MATMFDLDNLQNQSLLNIPNDTGFAVRPDYSKAGSNMARLSGFDLKSEAELNAMNQAEVDKYSENRLAARNKGIGELLYMFSDALGGRDIQGRAQARQQNRMLMQQDQERIARQQQLNEFITNANIPDSQKALLGNLPFDVQAEILAKQEFGNNKDRKIVKGADGFNYFVGTGERVLPEVLQNNKDRKSYKAGDGFLRYEDDGSRVFPNVERYNKDFVEPTPDNPMGLTKKEIFDRSDKLSDDFRAGSKDFIVARDSMNRILDAANNPSPFGDLSIIFGAMKLLDPNSVVRESEFKTVADAAPLLERIGFSKNKIEAIQAGNKLTDQQRNDVVGTVLKFYESAEGSQNLLQESYSNRAMQAGINPESVLINYGANVTPKKNNFEFSLSLQNMMPEQLKALDTNNFTEKEKEIYLRELKKLSQ